MRRPELPTSANLRRVMHGRLSIWSVSFCQPPPPPPPLPHEPRGRRRHERERGGVGRGWEGRQRTGAFVQMRSKRPTIPPAGFRSELSELRRPVMDA